MKELLLLNLFTQQLNVFVIFMVIMYMYPEALLWHSYKLNK